MGKENQILKEKKYLKVDFKIFTTGDKWKKIDIALQNDFKCSMVTWFSENIK